MPGEREALDNALQYGMTVTLRRTYKSGATVSVDVRAAIRTPNEEELLAGITQDSKMAIISPTQIMAAQWPGGELPDDFVAEPSLPRNRDVLIVRGRHHDIGRVNPIYVGDELVRIELEVMG